MMNKPLGLYGLLTVLWRKAWEPEEGENPMPFFLDP